MLLRPILGTTAVISELKLAKRALKRIKERILLLGLTNIRNLGQVFYEVVLKMRKKALWYRLRV